MFPESWSGSTLLLLIVVLALVWALWIAFAGGGFRRWWQDWSLRGARLLRQSDPGVAPPEVHRARGGDHPVTPPQAPHASPQHHRSGRRHG